MDFGTILLNVGYALNVIALAFREILWIRVLLTSAYLLRFLTQYLYENNQNTSVWMIIFVSINLFQIIQILNERRKRHIEPKIVDLFETVFNSLTSYEFLTFWKLGTIKSVAKNSTIIKEGSRQYALMLILDGEVNISKNNKKLTYLTRGHFIGEISFVSKEDTIADVIAGNDVTYIVWTKKQIDKLKRDNKIFWIKLQNILLKDMIEKIKRSNN
tara:strand:- start:1732 stop:2376 length:645 start_codon:yes stop_codon:yes gene_type:complete